MHDKAEVQVEAQQSIVNDTQDRSVERCSIDDDQVTQLNTKVDKILSSVSHRGWCQKWLLVTNTSRQRPSHPVT